MHELYKFLVDKGGFSYKIVTMFRPTIVSNMFYNINEAEIYETTANNPQDWCSYHVCRFVESLPKDFVL